VEERPKIDNDMVLTAAKVVAERMGVSDIVDTAESIAAEYSWPMDGFELAKALDRWQSWDTTRSDMEELDAMNTLVRKSLEKAEQDWFERNRPRPPFEVGARIRWRDITGKIDGIYEHGPAKYLVIPDNSTIGDGRYIVNFEDAEPLTGTQS
jgi:hypothetical protein